MTHLPRMRCSWHAPYYWASTLGFRSSKRPVSRCGHRILHVRTFRVSKDRYYRWSMKYNKVKQSITKYNKVWLWNYTVTGFTHFWWYATVLTHMMYTSSMSPSRTHQHPPSLAGVVSLNSFRPTTLWSSFVARHGSAGACAHLGAGLPCST